MYTLIQGPSHTHTHTHIPIHTFKRIPKKDIHSYIYEYIHAYTFNKNPVNILLLIVPTFELVLLFHICYERGLLSEKFTFCKFKL